MSKEKDPAAVSLGSRGGKKTREKHTDEWYKENQRKSVLARKRNKRLLRPVTIDSAVNM